jgi:hypothetical protein
MVSATTFAMACILLTRTSNPLFRLIRLGGRCRRQTAQSAPSLLESLRTSAIGTRPAALAQGFRIDPGGNQSSRETVRRHEGSLKVALRSYPQDPIPTPPSDGYRPQVESQCRRQSGSTRSVTQQGPEKSKPVDACGGRRRHLQSSITPRNSTRRHLVGRVRREKEHHEAA